MPNKIDSNVTGLAFAEEASLKTLPGSPVWYGLEPNSYNDLGGQLQTVARNPINATRQRKKGTVTDLDASGGINQDLTKTNLTRLLQGFFFANLREKFSTLPYNGTAITITGVTSTTYTAASGLTGFKVNQLVLASGFTNAANNGLKLLSAVASGSVTTTGNVVETPPAGAKLEAVGIQFAAADATLTLSGGNLLLNSAAVNLTTLGLNVGEWVFIGGDNVATQFVTGTNKPGYARISAIAAGSITFDKTTWTPVADTGTGKTVQLFFGYVLRNEDQAANIIRRSYQLERQLGNDGVGIQSEYLTGAIANELKLNVPQADKVNVDLSFVALNTEYRNGTTGVKSGTRVTAPGEDAFNTSSDVFRMALAVVNTGTLNPTPLVGYVSEASITINNGVTPNKAVGVLGGFDASAGNFEVDGSITAYFSDTTAVTAVRNNSDVTFDLIMAKKNAALCFDIPLIGLGNGRINVEQDQPVTLPLDMGAAQGSNNFTLLACFMPYVPTVGLPS